MPEFPPSRIARCASVGDPFSTSSQFMVGRSPSTTWPRLVTGVIATCMGVLVACAGCSRQAYRKWADRDAYRLIHSRETDWRWDIPDRCVEPDPTSRLADQNNPDCGPLPPDDPASRGYMRHPFNSLKRVKYWDKRGEQRTVDSERWLEFLPFNEDGELDVDKQFAVNLALLNNREFQTRVEQLHATALRLAENRFEYQLNWFGGNDTDFQATQDGADAIRDLSTTNQLGFTRNLATGGQIAANLVNSFTWQLGGGTNTNFATGNLLLNITQPLLRGAFRYVRTEALTQAERDLLYQVRDFARFRRQFYFDIVSQYLDLLNQAQQVRIEEANVRNLARNLDEHDLLLRLEKVSIIQVDQVSQRYQSGRIRLILAEQTLETSLDTFKFQLGLPARIPINIDESILDPFQLNSPEIEDLQKRANELQQQMTDYLPPDAAPVEFLDATYDRLKAMATELKTLKPLVDEEYARLQDKVSEYDPEKFDDAEKIDYEQQIALAERIEEFLIDIDRQIAAADDFYQLPLDQLDNLVEAPLPEGMQDDPAVQNWKKLQLLIAGQGGLIERINTLFVVQTQIRLFLIDLNPLELDPQVAVDLALENRLDLMNSRASVVDAFRRVEIAADQLQSDLDISASADLRTDPTINNAFRFDGDENIYNVSVEFDGPLNRFNERNIYRVAQLAYQQQRRGYMADEDSIVNQIRLDFRQLKTTRFNFQIARQQLITAARQVEQAQLNLGDAGSADSSVTQDLLNALQDLRDAENGLISNWILYETSRIDLFVDLELLLLDDQGVWINEKETFDSFGGDQQSTSLRGDASGDDDSESGTEREVIDTPEPGEPPEVEELAAPNDNRTARGDRSHWRLPVIR